MDRRTFVFFGPLALYATSCRAAAWALITRQEFEDSLAMAQPLARSLGPPRSPDAPAIEVDQPDATKPIRAPVTIRVRFHPKAGATIDPTTFRATYGALGLDITSRVVEHAHVSASGLLARNAEIPAGHHRVTLQVADNMHRIGSRTFEFTVV